jgi:hypothetical protein
VSLVLFLFFLASNKVFSGMMNVLVLCLMQGSAPEQQEKCKKASNFCYALWKEEANGTSILGQGEYSTVLCSVQTLQLQGLCY